MATDKVAISNLELRAFRNLDDTALQFQGALTAIVGPNGAGKTNILEAAAIGLTARSPRTQAESSCINDSEQQFIIRTEVVGRNGEPHQTAVALDRASGKQLKLDGQAVLRARDLSQEFPVSIFLPERLLAIRGAASRRRLMVDRLVTQVLPHAAQTLRSYTRAVSQRNRLIKKMRGGYVVNRAELAPWDDMIIEVGTEVRELRAEVLDRVQLVYPTIVEQLTGHPGAAVRFVRATRDELQLQLEATRSDELRRGATIAGPHHDDISLHLKGFDVSERGSAGQQRIALLAWVLSDRAVLGQATGIEPLLLLDEPFAELDAYHRASLTEHLNGAGNVVLTATDVDSMTSELQAAAAITSVREGAIGERIIR